MNLSPNNELILLLHHSIFNITEFHAIKQQQQKQIIVEVLPYACKIVSIWYFIYGHSGKSMNVVWSMLFERPKIWCSNINLINKWNTQIYLWNITNKFTPLVSCWTFQAKYYFRWSSSFLPWHFLLYACSGIELIWIFLYLVLNE